MGDLLKGTAWFATGALALVGALTFVPDHAWERVPESAAPIRAKLADYGIAPIKYRSDRQKERLASDEEIDKTINNHGKEVAKGETGRTRVQIGKNNGSRQRPNDPVSSDPAYVDPIQEDAFPATVDTPQTPAIQDPLATSDFTGVATMPEPSAEPVDVTAPETVVDPTTQNDPPAASPFADAPRDPSAELNAAAGDLFQNDSFDLPQEFNAPDMPVTDAAANDRLASNNLDPAGNPTLNVSNALLTPNDVADNNADGYQNSETQAPVSEMTALDNAAPTTQNIPAGGVNAPVASSAPEPSVASNAVTETVAIPRTNLGADAQSQLAVTMQDLEPTLQAARNIETTEDLRRIFLTLNQLRRQYASTMSAEELTRLDAALDNLAYEVLYNPRRAVFEPLRRTVSGETLASIASEYDVTPETLAIVNGLRADPDDLLPPGTTLKVMRGPVTAELSESRHELLVNFNNLYGGRFKYGIPQQGQNLRGQFTVECKMKDPMCDAVDTAGQKVTIPGGSPENPLGSYWIGLSGGYGLQGTNREELVGGQAPECGGFIFTNTEISQLNILLPIGATVYFVD